MSTKANIKVLTIMLTIETSTVTKFESANPLALSRQKVAQMLSLSLLAASVALEYFLQQHQQTPAPFFCRVEILSYSAYSLYNYKLGSESPRSIKVESIESHGVPDGYISTKAPAFARKSEKTIVVKIKKITIPIEARNVLALLPISLFSKFSQIISEGSLQNLT